MTDIETNKRRLRIFLICNGLMSVLTVIGIMGEFALKIPAFRPMWMAALLIGFAVQLWLILAVRRDMSGKEK